MPMRPQEPSRMERLAMSEREKEVRILELQLDILAKELEKLSPFSAAVWRIYAKDEAGNEMCLREEEEWSVNNG